ncbi:MAG: hypothetical protein A4S09_15045 [Proteobacteria bacterium SG_bin7]|nr:MAG: hypothetical protein A4S09_15045 [Proteobacteria bacterium SG_bin7]
MGARKKTTVYLEPEILKAAKLRAVEADQSLAEYLREAVVAQLAEDLDDIEIAKKRKKEPRISLEDVLKDLRKSGLI